MKGFMIVLLAMVLLLAGCSGGSYDAQFSPNLVSAELTSYNGGSNETQYIAAALTYDREIKADGFEPKIRIAGETVKSGDVTASSDGSVLTLTILVDKIKDGDITIKLGDPDKGTSPAITDVSGKYPAKAQTIEALAPSGLVLDTIESGAGSVTVEVTHLFDIRCIAWILFEDGGEPVGGSALNGADERDGAVALHGHEFLTDDLYDVADNLAEALANHFGDRYDFEVNGKAVTATSKTDRDAELAVSVYNYVRIGE